MGKSPAVKFFTKKIAPVLGALLDDRRPARGRQSDPVFEALVGRKGVLKDNTALGILLGTGLRIGQGIYARPGLQASIDSLVGSLGGEPAEERTFPAELVDRAQWIVRCLRQHGVEPRKLAVDGVPGSGKSTLARLLAEQLALQWRCLDHLDLDSPLDLSGESVVYEHHRLLRTQNLDDFDAILYIDEPVETSRAKVLQRKRGGYLVDVMDFPRLKRVGKKAFQVAAGTEIAVPDSCIRLKINPGGGFRILENVTAELASLGVRAAGASQEQLLFLATENQARKGFLAYLDAGAYSQEILSSVSSALLHLGKQR